MSQQETRQTSKPSGWKSLVRDTTLTIAIAALLAFLTNLGRAEPMKWVQAEPYDILVPCPEVMGDATEIPADSAQLRATSTLILDVRSPQEYAQWHLGAARNQPFDWLGPPVDAEVKHLAKEVARTGAQRVVIYGDGGDPDSGREWGRILSGAGLKNIHFVAGGAPAIRAAAEKGAP